MRRLPVAIPSDLLSGDQKGRSARSVPGTNFAVSESMGRR